MTVREALHAAPAASIARRDAELLLAHAAGQDRVWLLAHGADELPTDILSRFHNLVHRRAAGEPLQYVTGEQEFFGLCFHVAPGVLIPRPETEGLVEAVLDWILARGLERPRIVDVGTGSGAIALTLANRVPQAEVTALDLSPDALRIARGNAKHLQLSGRVRFLRSDLLFAVASERFDVVVSNPPYVPETDRPTMQPEVRDHEPSMALFAGEDGLSIYRRLIPEAAAVLGPGGLLAMEFGFGQRDALRGLLTGWSDVRFLEDLAGIPRVALAVSGGLC